MAPTLHPRQQPTPQSARIPPDVPSDPGISSLLGAYLRNFALWCRDGFAEQMRNNEALRGLMMLGDNAPAGTNPAVWLLSIGNGGTLHVTPMALGSGDLGTQIVAGSLNFKPLAGVVDGSNAPAGQVGEFLSNSASNAVTIPNNRVDERHLSYSYSWRLGRERWSVSYTKQRPRHV